MKVSPRAILGIIVTLFLVAFVPSTVYADSGQVTVSFYGGGGPHECGQNRPCHGSRTACGQVFNMHRVSVANKSLPCGTKVKFCHNDKCLIAKVTDRGPFVRGRDYDLSRQAAEQLGVTGVSVIQARVIGM